MRKAMVACLLVLLVPVLAGADLTVKEKTSIRGFMGMWKSEGTEITYLEGDKYRNESDVERSGMIPASPIKDPPPRVTIIRLDDGIMWRVNLKDKTYQEVSLEDLAEKTEAEVRFKIADLKVEVTGDTREIAGRDCKAMRAEVVLEVYKGEEVVDQRLDMLFWMTQDTEGLEEMRAFWEQSLSLAQGQDQIIPLWEALDKMWEEAEEFKGVPLGFEVTIEAPFDEEEKAEMERAIKEMLAAREADEESEPVEMAEQSMKITREVVSISTEELEDSLFEVPDDFNKAARIRIW